MKKKDIKNIVDNIGKYNPSEEDITLIENLQDAYKDKSDDELFVEIIRVNSEMEEQMSKEQYEEMFNKLESIRPMLSEEQNSKLDKILRILDKD
ncbi:hypothetical protein RBU61_09430 [Tissierella sp. MB52-C2]|uniref:hypothetical protein n=1 Tax=Tissierella sp. MB52-C2 TaxID=3070999 RepID=UPI00280BF2EF|nr:hypothetical protein [Tissierella sp. MB52-C2]WMM26872.1 hypothetical protein RBU61_09430 [Tissierella sp. MB52-C2]